MKIWGNKPIEERMKTDFESFFNDLQVLVDTDNLDESPKLYKKHPKVRIGIRRALIALKNRDPS